MIEQPKKCPKCGEDFEMVAGAYAIPGYLDHEHRGADKAEGVSMKQPLPVSVHFCSNCRFVELWAD
jgi:predicted nucleic-acid-binding Zn-ribbon protein